MDPINILPSWMQGSARAQIGDPKKDRAKEPIARCFLGSLAYIKAFMILYNNNGNKSTLSPKFPPPSITTATEPTVDGGAKTIVTGIGIEGFYAVRVTLKPPSQYTWKSDNTRGDFGHLSFRVGETSTVTDNSSIKYSDRIISSHVIIDWLEQFSIDLSILSRYGGELKNYCGQSIDIESPCSIEIGFIPVYSQWKIEIEHDLDSVLNAPELVAEAAAIAVVGIFTGGVLDAIIAGMIECTVLTLPMAEVSGGVLLGVADLNAITVDAIAVETLEGVEATLIPRTQALAWEYVAGAI
jgi:hypothetical protein